MGHAPLILTTTTTSDKSTTKLCYLEKVLWCDNIYSYSQYGAYQI